jgi:hypothetical protein
MANGDPLLPRQRSILKVLLDAASEHPSTTALA